jgi:putative intracellular protease/amidase
MRGKVRTRVDSAADSVRVDQLDALVIPGGYAPDKMRLHQSMVDLVKPGRPDEPEVYEIL